MEKEMARFRDAATKQIQELNTISENIKRDGTQHQQAADDAASSLGSSMGFSKDAFDFTSKPTTAPDGSIPAETLSLNFDVSNTGTEGFTSEQPAPEGYEGGWLIPTLA